MLYYISLVIASRFDVTNGNFETSTIDLSKLSWIATRKDDTESTKLYNSQYFGQKVQKNYESLSNLQNIFCSSTKIYKPLDLEKKPSRKALKRQRKNNFGKKSLKIRKKAITPIKKFNPFYEPNTFELTNETAEIYNWLPNTFELTNKTAEIYNWLKNNEKFSQDNTISSTESAENNE